MAASESPIQEGDGKAGCGCCHGCLSTTCFQRAQGASWSLNHCTLLTGDKDQSLSLAGKQKLNLELLLCQNPKFSQSKAQIN